jgi:hypothetical protein
VRRAELSVLRKAIRSKKLTVFEPGLEIEPHADPRSA